MRKFVPWQEVPAAAGYDEHWEIEWENLGFCRDGVTRWYHFTDAEGVPCYTLRR